MVFQDRLHERGIKSKDMPQLVIVGHGAVDDVDGRTIPLDVWLRVQNLPDDIKRDIKVAQLPDGDLVLNALMRRAHTALQLSLAEGFEVKVTEALHKGKPVIANTTPASMVSASATQRYRTETLGRWWSRSRLSITLITA